MELDGRNASKIELKVFAQYQLQLILKAKEFCRVTSTSEFAVIHQWEASRDVFETKLIQSFTTQLFED